jgi:hypothetical protein
VPGLDDLRCDAHNDNDPKISAMVPNAIYTISPSLMEGNLEENNPGILGIRQSFVTQLLADDVGEEWKLSHQDLAQQWSGDHGTAVFMLSEVKCS